MFAQVAQARANSPERSKCELSTPASQIQRDSFNNLKDLNKRLYLKKKKNVKKSNVKSE